MAGAMPELGIAELEVLKALWDGGPGTVRQVLANLHGRNRRVAYTTVLTVLTRLEQKGYVASDKSGLAYIYRAKVSRERVASTRVRAMVEQLYDGAAGQLALHLMKAEKFTAEEIDELQRLIERLDRE
jgi:BlaI family penicillinase repressor